MPEETRLALMWLTHPLTRGLAAPYLWLPPAGLGLVLVAWLGTARALPGLLLAGLLGLAHVGARASLLEGGLSPGAVAFFGVNVLLTAQDRKPPRFR